MEKETDSKSTAGCTSLCDLQGANRLDVPGGSVVLPHAKAKVNAALIKDMNGGARVAQSVQCPSSAQVMISRFRSMNPTWGSGLIVWSLLEILSLSLPHSVFAPPPLVLSLSLKINEYTFEKDVNKGNSL